MPKLGLRHHGWEVWSISLWSTYFMGPWVRIQAAPTPFFDLWPYAWNKLAYSAWFGYCLFGQFEVWNFFGGSYQHLCITYLIQSAKVIKSPSKLGWRDFSPLNLDRMGPAHKLFSLMLCCNLLWVRSKGNGTILYRFVGPSRPYSLIKKISQVLFWSR